MAERKMQVRFNAKTDIKLLREVLASDPSPFVDSKKWDQVAVNLSAGANFEVTARRVREHTKLILDQYKKNDRESLRRSGTVEDFEEKEQLPQELKEVEEELERSRVEENAKKAEEEKTLKSIRKRALESLTDKSDEEATPTKRSSQNVISYLKEKNKSENDIRKQELELRKEELALQRERFELERDERRVRMAADQQQANMMLELMKRFINK